MPYYPTIEEDLARARAILAGGAFGEGTPEDLARVQQHLFAHHPGPGPRPPGIVGGTIHGADISAAYHLLMSFVEIIEAIGPEVCKTALRARELSDRAPR